MNRSLSFESVTTGLSLESYSTTLHFADSMTDSLELTAGDTHEPVRARLFGPDGEPVDLTDARVTFKMTGRSGEVVIDRRATIDDETDEQGWVEYDWRRGDTDEPGTYNARFHVRFPDRTEMHYPNSRAAKILIRRP